MRITVVGAENELTNVYDVDGSLLVGDLMDIVAAERGMSRDNFRLLFHGNMLEAQHTLQNSGIVEDAMILCALIKETQSSTMNSSALDLQKRAIEETRQMLLNDAEKMARLEQVHPELAAAARRTDDDGSEFAAIMEAERMRMALQQSTMTVEQQREESRQRMVMENMAMAMEHHPEFFGSVSMLYVHCKINGIAIKAFVDCGAQATIMSEECMKRCALDSLLDERFSGTAQGIGTSRILGRIHSVQLAFDRAVGATDIDPLYLPCGITVIESPKAVADDSAVSHRTPDLLLGLDLLRRYQVSIDLMSDGLVILGRRVPFLPEHEIPK